MERLKRKAPTFDKDVVCKNCNKLCPRTGPVQLYCPECSVLRAATRSKSWARKTSPVRQSAGHAKGKLNSIKSNILSLPAHPHLVWSATITVPYDKAGSKNHVYSNTADGHLNLRTRQKAFRLLVETRIAKAIAGVRVAQNKLWVSIFVQKENHKGDAINFVDVICDGLKLGIGLDDRWFSIRSVDWEIVKSDPKIFISVGQEITEDVQACSYCGRLLQFSKFKKNAAMSMGISRGCGECI